MYKLRSKNQISLLFLIILSESKVMQYFKLFLISSISLSVHKDYGSVDCERSSSVDNVWMVVVGCCSTNFSTTKDLPGLGLFSELPCTQYIFPKVM